MLEPDNAAFSLRQQCGLLSINRSSLYYQPQGESEENLLLMRLLDEQYTQTPYYGVLKMEAHLRTLGHDTAKYQPDYPRRFDHYSHANQWCESFFDWYNYSHHHSTLAGYTPAQVFTSEYIKLQNQRQQTLDAHYMQYPQRFVNGAPIAKLPPEVVYINPVVDEQGEIITEENVNFSTLSRAKCKLT